ncbi:hypothetical protein [Lysinibacillus telephonicus]|uniref:hypothetical protein n=1 Tax=Lysinibacillus telephonicus TaxID=1714840 RepID=UPI00163A4C21|nr:hypothetical protein [Lysinibacillus telephonicus]
MIELRLDERSHPALLIALDINEAATKILILKITIEPIRDNRFLLSIFIPPLGYD